MSNLTSQRLIAGGTSDDELDEDDARRSVSSDEHELANRYRERDAAPTGLRKAWNYFASLIAFCCFASVGYAVYIHSVQLNYLVSRHYVEASGSLRNYSRSGEDYLYPKVYDVWLNLASDKLNRSQVSQLKKGNMVALDRSLGCQSLDRQHGPILSISLNFEASANATNGSGSGNYSILYDSYLANGMTAEDIDRMEEYDQYASYYGDSDYGAILAEYYFLAASSGAGNLSNLTGNGTVGNTTVPKNHTVNYAEDVYYMQDKPYGYLIVGMIVNTAFLLASYAMIWRYKNKFNQTTCCGNVWECQIHFKRVYFPKCKINKFFASLAITVFGMTTPIYFVASIMPAFAYDYTSEAQSGELCLVIIDPIVNGYGWDEHLLEQIFLFQFWWWLIMTLVFMLSFCLPEEYKRQSWQRGSTYVISLFMIASMVSGVFLVLTAKEEVLFAYGAIAGAYIVTFVLQLTMF